LAERRDDRGDLTEDPTMTFKPSIWFPIAAVLSVVNVIAVGFASTPAHTTTHAVLALAFGLWAQRLRGQSPAGNDVRARLDSIETELSKFGPLEDELTRLRQELGEAQERMDFTERLLAQRGEAHRVEAHRAEPER
jgi:hypothetical protein